VKLTAKSELRTGPLTTGKLVSGKLSTGTLDRPPQTSAVRALKEKTARGVRLVGETGDGQFRVSLSPVKKRKPKDKAEPQPLTRWSSSAFPWPDDPSTDLVIPSVDWPRRIAGVCATATNVQAPGTALVLEILPGAGDAVLFRHGTSDGANATGDLVWGLHAWAVPHAGAAFSGADACSGPLPADLWLQPNDRMRLRWSEPNALALSVIEGVIVRWENDLPRN
jgi:hypothetical protein